MRKREPMLIQMEVLASLFASLKVVTRLCQSCNINTGRIENFTRPMLAYHKRRCRRIMSDEAERGPEILDAHQEPVARIEESAGKMRALAILTVVVAAFMAVAYIFQLALPPTGTTSQTVDLTEPSLVATELVVLALALVWLYVGANDFRFTMKVKREISAAPVKERHLLDRIPQTSG